MGPWYQPNYKTLTAYDMGDWETQANTEDQ